MPKSSSIERLNTSRSIPTGKDRSKTYAEYNRSQFTRGLDALQTRLQNREYLLDAFRSSIFRPQAG
jgi:hypothetical protein